MKSLEEILQIQFDKNDGLQLVNLIDLTSLNGFDNENSIKRLIQKANQGIKGTHPAAICIYNNNIDAVRPTLQSDIKLAVVGCAFPHGQQNISLQLTEAKQINSSAIQELDIVMNLGDLISKDYNKILSGIRGIKNEIGTKTLKVILESGSLSLPQLKIASKIAIDGGADFIKTSTGKTDKGASYEAVYEMCTILKSHYEQTGKKVGIKPSGGISTVEDALVYYEIVKEVLGEEWLNNKYFRFGASSLFDTLHKKFN